MKNLLDLRILCLGFLVLTGSCSLDSLERTQYIEGIRNISAPNTPLTNIATNIITNITTNTNTVTTNTVTNVVTNNITNNVTNIVTNNITTVVTNNTTTVVTNNITTVVTNNTTNVVTNRVTNNITNVITNNTTTVVTNNTTTVVTNNVTNILTNTVTNVITNNTTTVVTNVVTNRVTNNITNTITNILTNTITNILTNTITNTNTDDPLDTRPAETKFLDTIKGKTITLTDAYNLTSSGTFSSDGKQLATNTSTSSGANAGSPASYVLSSKANPYTFKGVADNSGHVATYFGEHSSVNTTSTTILRENLLIVVSLNATRTGGTISSYRTSYNNYYSTGISVSGYPITQQFTATFTIPK